MLRLRWWMIAGQLVAILGVRIGLGLALPLPPLLGLIGLEAALNLAAAVIGARREPREWWLAALMACDIVLCTGLLALTGGPTNPFSFLYLVQIALAAITLRGGWTWALAALALLGSASLFVWHRPLAASHAAYMNLHLRGMWVAFGVAAGFIVYFLLRVRRALEARERELDESRRAAARQERLASLATLAAGAAHELSTPLATIAVVMKELEHHLARSGASSSPSTVAPSAVADVRLVREQVDRCRAILERMSSDAGETVGEGFVVAPVSSVVSSALVGLSPRVPVRTELGGGDSLRLRLPARAFAQALRGIIKNAQDASPDGSEIVVRVSGGQGTVAFEVQDRGAGIPRHVLDRIGEPFFTTKPTGQGMGLGVFLARAVVERLGGRVSLASAVGLGTIATLQLPGKLLESAAPGQ